ncbi:uncharacterized protein [Nicotiana tomentosiformis]|uniref:uncharacterized protein n=1 Tax=Nicotiana tomentosiformis TaxID=4098 RepID=UPI00388C33F0
MVNVNRMDWSKKLDDALWAYRTKKFIVFKVVFDKACLLPVELEHKAMWALKMFNLDWDVAANLSGAHLNELDEFRYHAYFKVGDLVLLFNSRFRMFSGKLNSKWSGPFEIVGVTSFGALDLKNKKDEVF